MQVLTDKATTDRHTKRYSQTPCMQAEGFRGPNSEVKEEVKSNQGRQESYAGCDTRRDRRSKQESTLVTKNTSLNFAGVS